MKKSLVTFILFTVAGSALAGGLMNYPETKVQLTKTRAEVKAETLKWLADPEAQKAFKELYGGGGN